MVLKMLVLKLSGIQMYTEVHKYTIYNVMKWFIVIKQNMGLVSEKENSFLLLQFWILCKI